VPIDPRLPDIKKIVLFVVLGNSLRELRRNWNTVWIHSKNRHDHSKCMI
jgi:hypothetical protein